jgi:hypothetical protein
VSLRAAPAVRDEMKEKACFGFFRARLFVDSLHGSHTGRTQKRPKTGSNCRQGGSRMTWLLAWLIFNALVLVWRVLMVSTRIEVRDRPVRREGGVDAVARSVG